MGYIDRLLSRNERVVFVTRRHWLTLLPTLLGDAVLTLLALGAVVLLFRSDWKILAILPLVLAALPLIHLLVRLLNWWNLQYLVTNRRVMEVRGVINKRVSDSSLEKVNDVVMRQSILGRMLGYGDVEIITGSDVGVNLFRRIARPVRLKTEMLNQKESLGELDAFEGRSKRVLVTEAPQAGDIPELIAELDELRQKGLISDEEFEEKRRKLLDHI
ncbi:MAG: hypothetical protein D6759_00295 [Chloroflexi bacterium]|nr:MAG: hypothetical protein D6759_00295 [Chloroflexota bacterium]